MNQEALQPTVVETEKEGMIPIFMDEERFARRSFYHGDVIADARRRA